MPRSRTASPLPACYAMVHPGLEPIAAEEIENDIGGEIKRTSRGIVVFRVDEINERLLQLRTTEDVFVLAWGSDQLSHRAEDLDRIERWTAREPDWNRLLKIHHAVRPKPKGKTTYHLVTQMEGKHAYLRRDARQALIRGLAGKLPASWPLVDEDASVEIWLTIHGTTALCGVRLSDRTMRHRAWKEEHRPASLRPTLAAAMVRIAEIEPQHVVLDPMCGAGTLLAEHLAVARSIRGASRVVLGGDREFDALRAAGGNLRRLGVPYLSHWDATQLPLASCAVDRIITNPPFGKQMGEPEEIGPLYRAVMREYARAEAGGGHGLSGSRPADVGASGPRGRITTNAPAFGPNSWSVGIHQPLAK